MKEIINAKTSNSFEAIQEEEEEDELNDEDYWKLEALQEQLEDERALEQAWRAQVQEERAMILMARKPSALSRAAFHPEFMQVNPKP